MTTRHSSAQIVPGSMSNPSFTKNKIGNYPALNGLRFIAALAVVCFHYCPAVSWPWVNRVFAVGPAAVGFFFLLSGFVLALHHPNVSSRGTFWRARLIRIYPMYIFAFLLFLPIGIAKYHHDPKMLLISMAVNLPMVQAWTSLSQSWNGPSWSLSAEAFMYLTFPLLVRRMVRFNHLAAWAALSAIPPVLTVAFCQQWLPASLWRSWIGNNPIFWLPLFCFGIALGLRRKQSNGSASLSVERERSRDLPIFASLGCVILLAIFCPVQYREIFINGGPAILFGFIVLLCTYRSPWAEKLFGNPAMDRMGRASYITYIVQAPLWHYFMAFSNLFTRHPLSDSRATMAQFLVFAVVLVGISLCLDLFVDEPVRNWFNRKRKPYGSPAVCPIPQTSILMDGTSGS